MTGFAPASAILATTSGPLSDGITMSESTTSNRVVVPSRTASVESLDVTTVYPRLSRVRRARARTSGSSSTSRIVSVPRGIDIDSTPSDVVAV